MTTASAATSPTRTARWFPALDGLRAIGALAVVLTHVGFHSGRSLNGWSAPVLSRLDIGVAIFFVLSGFLLYRPHVRAALEERPRVPVRRYLAHRVLRIVPAYWVVVAAAAVLLVENDAAGWQTWLRTATFTQIYTPGTLATGLTQMWSLATEVAFYLLLPVVAAGAALWSGRAKSRAALLRRQAVVVTGCMAVTPAFLLLVDKGVVDNPAAGIWLPAYLGWFGLGMALAVGRAAVEAGVPGPISGRAVALASAPGTLWLAAAMLFVILTTPIAGPRTLDPPTGFEAAVKNALYGVVAVLLVLPAALRQPDSRVVGWLSSRPMRVLGEISYGIFLYHLLVLELVRRWLGHVTFSGQFWMLAALTLAITLPLAWVSYHLMERPLMRWGRARTG
jgi:peptidoglycan/LPS O-acetylase OafA/YrhL